MKLKPLVCLSLIKLVGSFALMTQAQTFSVIHRFTGVEGRYPEAGVTVRGNSLYGTAFEGGNSFGSVYEVQRVGSDWVTVPLYLFGAGEGGSPMTRVVFGPDGHLYGATYFGGPGFGTVFDLIPPLTICKTANCFWKENVLDNFMDGADPFGDLVWDDEGDIYGTLALGGAYGYGFVYELTKSGNNWTETPIYSFYGTTTGDSPEGGVVLDSHGNLFGTTYGGPSHYGTIFELKFINGSWVETFRYDFQNGSDGRYPMSGLAFDSSGNLYGATSEGGNGNGGTIFELSQSGDSWTFNLLYSLSALQDSKNCGPWRALTVDAGNLYGTTYCDGPNNLGNVFKLTNTQNGWVYTSLHDFTGGQDDGANPRSEVAIDTGGHLYGTTTFGGLQDFGVVWRISQ